MTRTLHLWPENHTPKGDRIEVSVALEGPRRKVDRLIFTVPSEDGSNLTPNLDPFLLAIIFRAMRVGADLEIHGPVSPSLLRGLENFQLVWSQWRPERYRPVAINAESEQEVVRAAEDRTVMAFSGGLDSCCTARRHTRGDLGRRSRRPEAAVMAHGFDIPLRRREVFERAAARSKAMLDSIGVRLIPVECNIRDLSDTWDNSHGAALAACLHLLAGGYSTGLIAASHTYDNLRFPWGSTPLTDPMLGSSSMAIVHDGADLMRWDKADQIGDWDEALHNLRVCWEGLRLDRNCGRCMRCVATALCFATVGRPIPPAIPVPSPEEAVERLRALEPTPVQLTHFENKIARARRDGITDPWVGELERFTRERRDGPSRAFERLIALGRRLSGHGSAGSSGS